MARTLVPTQVATTVERGGVITPAPALEIRNDGVLDADLVVGNVSVRLADPQGAVLGGTLARSVAGGVIEFDDLTVDRAGVYELIAEARIATRFDGERASCKFVHRMEANESPLGLVRAIAGTTPPSRFGTPMVAGGVFGNGLRLGRRPESPTYYGGGRVTLPTGTALTALTIAARIRVDEDWGSKLFATGLTIYNGGSELVQLIIQPNIIQARYLVAGGASWTLGSPRVTVPGSWYGVAAKFWLDGDSWRQRVFVNGEQALDIGGLTAPYLKGSGTAYYQIGSTTWNQPSPAFTVDEVGLWNEAIPDELLSDWSMV